MTEAEEAAFDRRAEKHFKSQPELPNNRNFVYWNHDKDIKGKLKYRNNFDSVFPNSPGAGL